MPRTVFLFGHHLIRKNQYALMRSISCLRACTLCILLLILITSGCGKRQPLQFTESKRAVSLDLDVRNAIASELTGLFGTVDSPQVPDWLPIERGGTKGIIKKIVRKNNQGQIVSLVIEWKESELEIKQGDFIEVQLESSSSASKVQIEKFDPSSGLITLTSPISKKAEVGTVCVVNPNEKLLAGRRLYSQFCAKCHAATGDGNGPQSSILKPRPRDFRLGIVKYTSTKQNVKASTKDLKHLLKSGIAGTGMPAFQLLGNHEIGTLVEYTKYLSMRGEIERLLCIEAEIDFSGSVLDDLLKGAKSSQEKNKIRARYKKDVSGFLKVELPEIVVDVAQTVSQGWKNADDPENVLTPSIKQTDPLGRSKADSSVSSIANGKKLFLSTSTQCVSCHGKTGKGNGVQTTTFQRRPDGTKYEKVGLHDTWGLPVAPRDLTYGVFCGGREPIDLFRRISVGVKGTPMPAFGGKGLTEEQIWDLVNYIYFLAGDYPNVSAESLGGQD